jgi:TDG/mug DNA glycosylase family protein
MRRNRSIMRATSPDPSPAAPLPDLLAAGLAVVFVGINPGLYSAARGHYFARKTNRFWPAFSASRLSAAMRRELGVERLLPEHDRLMPRFGFGFTDIVKRASANAAELGAAEFVAGAAALAAKLAEWAPRIACFHGLTAYRPFWRARFADAPAPLLGLQPQRLGTTALFVVPNPSPANAHFTLADQTGWYDRLGECLVNTSS